MLASAADDQRCPHDSEQVKGEQSNGSMQVTVQLPEEIARQLGPEAEMPRRIIEKK